MNFRKVMAVFEWLPDISKHTKIGRYQDFRETFSTPHGQRTLAHIMNFCGPFDARPGIDPHDTYRKVGKREVASYILDIMKRVPSHKPLKAQGRDDGGS